MEKKFRDLHIELTEGEYEKLQHFVNSGRYRTKISIIREAIKNLK